VNATQLLEVVWRRRLTALLTFLVALGAAAAVTFSLPKVYSSTAYLLVGQTAQAGNAFEAVQINQLATRTYGELLQTRNLAEDVSRRVPWTETPEGLLAATSVSVVSDSQLLALTAEADSPERARQIANTYASTFVERSEQLREQGGTDTRVAVAEAAPLVDDPVRPRPRLYLAIAAVLAAAAAVGVALLRHRLDQRIEIATTTTEVLGLPVLGRVPQRSGRGDADELADAFRFLLTNLAFANQGRRPGSIAVVSSNEREGKTTTSLNIARAAAELGISVAVVDADLRRPSLVRMLELETDEVGGGLSSFLAGSSATAITELALPVPGSSLQVVPAGPVPPNPAALLGSEGLGEFEERARKVFDLIVIDTPPLTVGPDASLVAAAVEGVVLVLDPGRTRRNAATRSVEQLRRAQGNVLGVVLNRTADELRTDYYHADAGRGGGNGSRTQRRQGATRRA
jgi:polysaccharide biosynthesis transport protein